MNGIHRLYETGSVGESTGLNWGTQRQQPLTAIPAEDIARPRYMNLSNLVPGRLIRYLAPPLHVTSGVTWIA